MPDQPEKGGVLEVTCPCCEARLTVDPASGAVLGSEKAAHARAGVDLKDARRVLEQETARIHERYDQIVQTEKGRGAVLEKLYKSHIEKSKDEPAPRPPRRRSLLQTVVSSPGESTIGRVPGETFASSATKRSAFGSRIGNVP